MIGKVRKNFKVEEASYLKIFSLQTINEEISFDARIKNSQKLSLSIDGRILDSNIENVQSRRLAKTTFAVDEAFFKSYFTVTDPYHRSLLGG